MQDDVSNGLNERAPSQDSAQQGERRTGEAPPDTGKSQAQPDHQRPADTIRMGPLKAVIWRNEGEHGPYYATNISRTFLDQDGNFQDSHSFRENDLLRLSKLADRADDRVSELRREHMRGHERDRPQEGAKRDGGRQEFAESRTSRRSQRSPDRGR